MPLLSDYDCLRVLDLGCGIGRNSIYIAENYRNKCCMVDCVDILDIAIEKLKSNARTHGVGKRINGILGTIEQYGIHKNTYDLVLAVSALEHVESENSFIYKLQEIKDGIKSKGIVCLVINSEIREVNRDTYEELDPQFEVNLPTEVVKSYIDNVFAGWNILKKTVSFQEYDIPRDSITSHLTTNVITFVGQSL